MAKKEAIEGRGRVGFGEVWRNAMRDADRRNAKYLISKLSFPKSVSVFRLSFCDLDRELCSPVGVGQNCRRR